MLEPRCVFLTIVNHWLGAIEFSIDAMAGYSLVDAAVYEVMDAVALPFDEGNSHAQGDGTLADEEAWCADDLDGCFGPFALREDLGNELSDLWRHNLEFLIYVTNVPVAVAGPRLAEAASDA